MIPFKYTLVAIYSQKIKTSRLGYFPILGTIVDLDDMMDFNFCKNLKSVTISLFY